MTTHRRVLEFWTETKRVIDKDGEPFVKQVTCCCDAPADKPEVCSKRLLTGRAPCRCDCHRG